MSSDRMRQRQPRERNPTFLAFVRRQPCCVCLERHPVEAAHIRMGSMRRGKSPTGMQQKPDDKWAVPLCPRQHRLGRHSQHGGSERQYWLRTGVDPFIVAERLYAAFVAVYGEIGTTARPRRRASVSRSKARPPKRKMRSNVKWITRKQAERIWPSRKIVSRGFSK